MPQVDLETLVCGGGGDGKIACETLIDDHNLLPEKQDIPETLPDQPAESFWLSKDQELDWFDQNAFYERKESKKGTPNSNFSSNLNSNSNANSNSASQRFSLNLKSKASIIGLPKPQNSCYIDSRFRRNCRPSNIRFFPKKSYQASGRSVIPVAEPSSPKVSCIGRVRSKKDRSRHRWRNRRQSTEKTETATAPTTPAAPTTKLVKSRIWASFKAIFRSGCRAQQAVEVDDNPSHSPPRESFASTQFKSPASEPAADPPGLGGLKRFASGRKSDSWLSDDLDESFDRDSIWQRRNVDPLNEVDCRRDWEVVGPASV
ncbi:PREDICTED: uncharacterized protein LOC104588704 [Nelumbo nucifera]|uniref:Uncharacterized protein LOC104588704 n=1 Tax=Nelumbo nucifera TaxID=4432 RepID=A0A1U7YX19_NELNU|nr:PREDICTED: uncharacterized protein LOC104588704 [Nelumbo nucifera]